MREPFLGLSNEVEGCRITLSRICSIFLFLHPILRAQRDFGERKTGFDFGSDESMNIPFKVMRVVDEDLILIHRRAIVGGTVGSFNRVENGCQPEGYIAALAR